MRYKVELSIMFAVLLGLSLAGIASANSVTKTLYIDGVKVGSATASQALTYPYQRLTIGAEGSRYYPYNGLVGEMDEFAVWGRVLTDANVAALYGAGAGGYVAAVNAANPLLYLRFEDASSADGSKLTNSGSLGDVNSTYIGAITQDLTGYVSRAAILHGATNGTGDCIDVCDWDGRLYQSNVTVAFWVKTTMTSDYPRFFQHNGGNTEQRSFGAMYNASSNSVGLIGGGTTNYINLSSPLNNGAWHHVVVTYQSLIPASYQQEVMADDPCVYLRFDHPLIVDSSINHYWANVTTNATIKPTKGAMGGSALYLVNLTGGGGDTGRAYIWNNYNGVNFREFPGWTNTWDPGYSFVTDTIGTPPNPTTTVPGNQTFEFWYKSDPTLTPNTYGCFFQQIDGMSYDSGSGGPVKEPNAPALSLTGSAGARQLRVAGGSQWWYPGVSAPLDNDWHQIVVAYDQNEIYPPDPENHIGYGYDMGIQLYIDGSLAASTTIRDPNEGHALLGPNFFYTLVIGSEQNFGYGTNTVGGYYDEFAVYPGVLSADRIGAHYAAWQPKDCAEAINRGLAVGDFNGDCVVDMFDLAILAQQWRTCNSPGVAGCGQNW